MVAGPGSIGVGEAGVRLLQEACLPCSRRFRWPSLDESDRCDWCGARGVVTFRPVVVQAGPLVLIGDACAECWPALEPGQAAA